MDILTAAQNRYTTKAFDPNQIIDNEIFDRITESLRLAPSSVNIQPWHFFVAQTNQAKEKVATAMREGYTYNVPKVLDASHVLVFTTRTDITPEYLDELLAQDEVSGRLKDEKAKQGQKATREMYVDFYRNDEKNLPHWLKYQTYLALGHLLLTASAEKVDTTAMEGFDRKILDEVLGLKEKGLTSTVIVSLGYHQESDFNAQLPKSRLDKSKIFTIL